MRQANDRGRVMLAVVPFLAFLLLGARGVQAQDDLVLVRWENELLSVSAKDVPHSRVLEQVSRTTGLEFRGLEGHEGMVSLNIAGLPLNQALPILLGDLNFVFLSSPISPRHATRAVVLIIDNATPASTVPRSPAETPPGFEEALRVLRTSVDPNERLTKTEAWLAQEADPSKMEEVLQTAARDPEPLVRELALQQLRERNAQLWRETLLEQAMGENVDLRRTATQLLTELPEGSSLDLLRRATEDENIDVRDAAFQNLAHLAERGGLDVIRERLVHPNPEIRLMAIETMASKGVELATEAASFARNDSDELVRAKAEGILAALAIQ